MPHHVWISFERHRYLRMPLEISLAAEECQQQIHDNLEDLPGVEVIAYDILVYGCGATQAEYTYNHATILKIS